MRRPRQTRDVLEGLRSDREGLRGYQEALARDFAAEDARRVEAEEADAALEYPADPDCLLGEAHWWVRNGAIKVCRLCGRSKDAARREGRSGWTCLPAHPYGPEGRKRLSLCGNYTDARDLVARDPTCPDCRREWARQQAEIVDGGVVDDFPF